MRISSTKILAEIFRVSVSEAEDMIRLRCEGRKLWPERFWLE